MTYTARKALARDNVAKPFVVEHESGRIAAGKDTWFEACVERNHLNQLETLAQPAQTEPSGMMASTR
jgi:hypothetical protein